MEILRGMEVKITGVIHRLFFLKKKINFFYLFFFLGGGGIFVQIIGGHGPRAPPYSYGPVKALFTTMVLYHGCSKEPSH